MSNHFLNFEKHTLVVFFDRLFIEHSPIFKLTDV